MKGAKGSRYICTEEEMLCLSILRLGRWNVYWVLKQPIGLFVISNVDRRRCEQGPPISLLPSLDAGGFLLFFSLEHHDDDKFFLGVFFGEGSRDDCIGIHLVRGWGVWGRPLGSQFLFLYLLTPFCCSTMTALRAVSFGGFFFCEKSVPLIATIVRISFSEK